MTGDRLTKSTILFRLRNATATLVSKLLVREDRPPRLLPLAEGGLAFLQGKGAGRGWDRTGEAIAAARLIESEHPVVFDVGANRGQWLTAFTNALEPGIQPRFFVCEPATELQKELEAVMPAQAVLVQAAVSDRKGKATLFSSEPGSVSATLFPRENNKPSGRESVTKQEVPTTTVDEIVREHQLDRIDLLKIDAEGSELAILKGAEEAFARRMIKALTFEFGEFNVNARTLFLDFWELLTTAGFEIRRICPGGRSTPVPVYGEELEYFRGITNYIGLLRR